MFLGQPASIGHWTGSANACAEGLGQVENDLKLLFVRQASPASHNDVRLAQIHLALSCLNNFEHFAPQNLRCHSDVQPNHPWIRLRLDFISVEGSLLQRNQVRRSSLESYLQVQFPIEHLTDESELLAVALVIHTIGNQTTSQHRGKSRS